MTYKIIEVTAEGTEWETSYRDLEKDLAVEIASRLTREINNRCYFYPTTEN